MPEVTPEPARPDDTSQKKRARHLPSDKAPQEEEEDEEEGEEDSESENDSTPQVRR